MVRIPILLFRPSRWMFLLLLLHSSFRWTSSFSIRDATNSDVMAARKILFQEKMNPLSISTDTLMVAYDDDQDQYMLGFGQIRSLDDEYSELASLFVLPEYRKRGIGSAIVQALLDRHRAGTKDEPKVCLLTLKQIEQFYKPFGFRIATKEELKALPKNIQLEYTAGTALSFLLGNELICMVE